MILTPPGRTVERRRLKHEPLFSICVPQYARTDFFLKALEGYATQTFRDFEICISDDHSPEARHHEILAFLDQSGMAYAYQLQERNLQYDGNLRAAMRLARGKYCLLMGNDDTFAGPTALAVYSEELVQHGPAGVVIPDYADATSGQQAGRIRATRNWGAGPEVAAARFRNFGFVSGIALEREGAQRFATDRWDGSEYYQMFVGCRILASGGQLLELNRVVVFKDVQVFGQEVDSYAKRPQIWPCRFVERPLPLNQFGRLVADAIAPYCTDDRRRRLNEQVFRQLYLITYPYWLTEYRKVQSWRYAVGVALGMRPERTMVGVDLIGTRRWRALWAYRIATLAGLVIPLGIFEKVRTALYRFVKR